MTWYTFILCDHIKTLKLRRSLFYCRAPQYKSPTAAPRSRRERESAAVDKRHAAIGDKIFRFFYCAVHLLRRSSIAASAVALLRRPQLAAPIAATVKKNAASRPLP